VGLVGEIDNVPQSRPFAQRAALLGIFLGSDALSIPLTVTGQDGNMAKLFM
jgi:hypothetical protein